ncbi:MAG: hypothetical protein JWQ60_3056, partial [Pseudonocardia sp.]|nr:hypothetical protein [Pseudonocardia sp.]
AEQRTSRDEATIGSLTEQLTAARTAADTQQEKAAQARAELAAVGTVAPLQRRSRRHQPR